MLGKAAIFREREREREIRMMQRGLRVRGKRWSETIKEGQVYINMRERDQSNVKELAMELISQHILAILALSGR